MNTILRERYLDSLQEKKHKDDLTLQYPNQIFT